MESNRLSGERLFLRLCLPARDAFDYIGHVAQRCAGRLCVRRKDEQMLTGDSGRIFVCLAVVNQRHLLNENVCVDEHIRDLIF